MDSVKDINRFAYIDALRGIAILLVLVVHVAQSIPGASPLFVYVASRGQFGVQLFFIVSAFTLFLSYEQRHLIEGSQSNKFFFLRRFFRIAPMFYTAIVFYSVVLLSNNGYVLESFQLLSILVSFMFLQTFYPPAINLIPPGGWTVATEMLFYLTIPYLFGKLKKLKDAVTFFVASFLISVILKWTIIALAMLFFDKKIGGGWYLYYWFPNQLPVFAVGIICYHLAKDTQFFRWVKWYGLLILAGVWMFLVLAIGYKYTVLPQHILVSLSFGGLLLAMNMHNIYMLQNSFFIFFW